MEQGEATESPSRGPVSWTKLVEHRPEAYEPQMPQDVHLLVKLERVFFKNISADSHFLTLCCLSLGPLLIFTILIYWQLSIRFLNIHYTC